MRSRGFQFQGRHWAESNRIKSNRKTPSPITESAWILIEASPSHIASKIPALQVPPLGQICLEKFHRYFSVPTPYMVIFKCNFKKTLKDFSLLYKQFPISLLKLNTSILYFLIAFLLFNYFWYQRIMKRHKTLSTLLFINFFHIQLLVFSSHLNL